MFSSVFLVLHWSLALLLTARLMLKRKPIGESLAWLFVIYALPLAGAALYYGFGERRQGDKRIRRLKMLSGKLTQWQSDLVRVAHAPQELGLDLEDPIARFVEQATGYPPVLVHDWVLLDSFDAVFEALVRSIDEAQQYCHLEFYIWEPGGIIEEIHQALLRARARGVRVWILVDSIGSDDFLGSRHWRDLADAGCEMQVSMRMRLLGGRWDLRNHRKLAIIDGKVGFTGSMNLVDPDRFKKESGVGRWVDAMVQLHGAGAHALHGVFLQDWFVEREHEHADDDSWAVDLVPGPSSKSHNSAMQVLPSGPGIFSEAIHQVLMMAIYGAQTELIVSTPYFVPGDAILQAMISTAMRGVRVVLILPRKGDTKIARFAGASHYAELLDAGVEIAHFDGGLLHTKSLTVDGRLSIFGTVNLDMRSLWLNSEVTLLMYDAQFTAQLRNLQMQYLAQSEPLVAKDWEQRPRYLRALENMARLLGPMI
ncbi:MAG TPA: cardiolipin synthase [Planctomycetota bacterium]|nr:cardiolipin synthase [Planctomycetota bacterium]